MHYRFGEYLLDTQRYALRGQGTWTPLRPKIFAVLLYLIRHRDRVVSKTELLEHIWPAQFRGGCTRHVPSTLRGRARVRTSA